MAKSSMVMRLIAVVLATMMAVAPPVHTIPSESEEAVDAWFANLPQAKQRVTKLHLFIHDVASGPDPSIVPVAQASVTATSPTQFGIVNVLDDPLTEGPEIDSGRLGYVQGVYVLASKEDVSLLVAINFVFTEGEHRGSTLSVLGRIAEFSENREFPVLGGSGDFRLAQGIVVAHVYSGDPATGNRIVECRFHILHYDDSPSLKATSDV